MAATTNKSENKTNTTNQTYVTILLKRLKKHAPLKQCLDGSLDWARNNDGLYAELWYNVARD